MNVVPVIRTIQKHWPETELTWITSTASARLVGDLPGVKFKLFDKNAGRSGMRKLKDELANVQYEFLLNMHASWRANLAGRLVNANLKLGFTQIRSRDKQHWFTDSSIMNPTGRHVVDGFFAFLETLGLTEQELDWSLPLSSEAIEEASRLLPPGPPALLISPCSSHSQRNWRPERYAAVADYAIKHHEMRVVLVGGPTSVERAMGEAICSEMSGKPLNLIGRSPFKTLIALMERAHCLITPDSGPAHISNAAHLPTIALHAATESARSGPYTSLHWCVDRFEQAALKYRGKPASALPWATRIEEDGVMDLIEVADVVERLNAVMSATNN